jgi:hypothetical protein
MGLGIGGYGACGIGGFGADIGDEFSPLRKSQSKMKMATNAIAKKMIPPL